LCFLVVVSACDWGQFGNGPDHTHSSADATIKMANVSGLVQKWSAATGSLVESSPAVAGGVAYVGSQDGNLDAYDAVTGARRWSFATGGPVTSSPAVDNGIVFVGSDDHKLYAIRADNGAGMWSVSVDATFVGLSSAPTVTGGLVYVAGAQRLYAYGSGDGSLRWSAPLASSVRLSAPAVANGLVYAASYADATLWALRADTGVPAWSLSVPGPRTTCATAVSSPAVFDGFVYVALCPSTGAPTTSVFAYRADSGAPVWASGTAVATTSPAVAQGAVFVASASAHTVEAHSVGDGTRLWTASTGGAIVSSPAIANGALYVGSDDNKLYAFDAAGQTSCGGAPRTCSPLWTATTGGPVRSSPAVANGVIYVGSDDHLLYAFGLPPIGFGKSVLQGTSSTSPSVARFGPDGRLYVAQYDGLITAYTVARNGSNAYAVIATETINLVQQIPNHDDDGTANSTVTTRLITGLLVVGSSASPVLYVSSSDPRIGGGPFGLSTNVDTNSGVISRLTRNGPGWQRRDLVRGLPRSEENHATNTLVLDQAANRLYVAQGGNTNLGAPSHNFNNLPEYAYSAAILTVDLNAIGASTYDLPTLVDENHPTLTGPFGGDFGRHQAKITPSSPVQVYAPGFRNPFSLVKTRAGKLFAIDNGANAGWGDIPVNAGPAGVCTNDVQEPGVHEADSLHLITGAGYYAGHANPTRGNRANTFNTSNPQSPVPTANSIECDARDPSRNGSLAQLAAPTTGMAEYSAGNFANQMNGDLIVAGYNNELSRIHLNDTGDGVVSTQVLVSNLGTHPVDVATQGDRDAFPGTIWVPDFADGSIYVFEPNDYGGHPAPPCSGAYSTTLDEDHDGYTNADEIDNHTDPCSAADTPHDWNHNFVSDLNDPDDDSDGWPDTSDPFAIDARNGLTTPLPRAYSWKSGDPNPCAPTPFPSGCPGGLLGLGFTGLMTNGHTDYLKLYDVTNMTVGGAAGVLTIGQVPPGDAYGATNTQQYGFQFGVDANPARAGAFTAHTRIDAPFAGLTPQGNQSMGFFIGNGDQDNYVKLVASANGGSPGIQFVKEVGGTDTVAPIAPVAMPGPDAIDLYLTVDPAAATVQARYRITTGGVAGTLTALGGPEPIPSAWLTSTVQGLAVGIIATSAGGPTFPATWHLLETTLGAPS
jgi:outer membrane protein assembly factor BamB